MSATPEAIRLAAWLRDGAWHQMRLGDVEAAGRELIRLHSANQDLLESLRQILNYENRFIDGRGNKPSAMFPTDLKLSAYAAIQKATGETP